jgi:hypothetical protein
MNAESIVIGGGFFVIGISIGFLAMLILRMAIHARKFQFAGCLAVVTTLSGGGFLSYLTKPIHFGLYSISFFFGFVAYLFYLLSPLRERGRSISDIGGIGEKRRGRKAPLMRFPDEE